VTVTTLTEEITVTSLTSPEEAVRQAVAKATSLMPDVENVEVRRVEALLEDMSVVGYRVTLEVTHSLDPESAAQRREHRDRPEQVSSDKEESQLELVRQRVLLEDLSQEDIERSERFLTISPAKSGSGRSDVSLNHDRYLFED
jgi:flavin-binding protein dodecin